MIPERAIWRFPSVFGPFPAMKTWHPRCLLCSHDSSLAVREIGGFRNCRTLERVELAQLVEVVGRGAFGADEGGRGMETRRSGRPIFLMTGEEWWLQRRRRECHVFIAGKGPKTDGKRQIALSGIISYLTGKYGGNVHDRSIVEITRAAFSGPMAPLGMLPTSEVIRFSSR
jgi:hypothetical protein